MKGGENLSEKNFKLRGELIEKVKTLRGEQKAFEEERRTLSAQFAETLETLKKKNADVNAAKDKMPYKSAAEIDARIADMEKTLESGRFTLSEERQTLQEITKLRKLRKTIDAMASGTENDITSLRFRLDLCKSRQAEAETKIAVKREEIAKVNTEIDTLNGIRAAEKVKKVDTKTEVEKLRKELDAEYAKKKAAFDEYLQAKAAKEAAYHRMVARHEEESRVNEIEKEIDQLEKKLGRLSTESVIDKKWNECTNLINFFSPMAPQILATEPSALPTKNLRKIESTIDSKNIIKRSNEEESYFVPSNRKGKKSSSNTSNNPEASSSSDEINKLPFHILAALTDMALPVPKSIENDLPELLKTVQARRNDLQVHRDASLAEMEAKRSEILQEIEELRAKIENKDEQITASVIKKAEKAEKAGASEEQEVQQQEIDNETEAQN
jgi:chromosome segregation ATPase